MFLKTTSTRSVLLASVVVLFFSITANAQSSPGNTVKAFYKWYVHALNRNVNEPLKSDNVTARRYVTSALLRRIKKAMASEEGIDADYFLSAQDFDKNWENNIVIGKVSTAGVLSTVNAVLPSKMMGDRKLKISLRRDGNLWKIDKVNDLDL